MLKARLIAALLDHVEYLKARRVELKQQHSTYQTPDSHYDDVGEEYEDAFFYEDGSHYNQWYLEQVHNDLGLAKSHKFVDLGGGTGNFTKALSDKAKLIQSALVVDPFVGMLNKVPSSLDKLLADSVAFAKTDNRYDRILMKEMIHHIEIPQLPEVLKGIYGQLNRGGRLVVCTRPSKEVEYPFFAAAFEEWEKHQPAHSLYMDALENAGFVNVTATLQAYPCKLAKARWLKMVRSRFWSTFSYFTDEELEAGIQEIEAKYEGMENLEFNDVLVFISGNKMG